MTTKAVFITGASSGIGRHCALRLVKEGFKVHAGVRSEKAKEELAQIAPGQLQPVLLDITNSEHIESAARLMSSENLHGLVNNAGIAVLGPLEFIPLAEIRQQFEVNLFGHMAFIQALLPILRKTGGGRIVNISSVSGLVAFPFSGAYASSKFAFEAFSDSLRRELAPWDIRVSLVEPGNVSTPIWQKSFHTAQSLANNFPPEAETYYGEKIRNMRQDGKKLIDPSAVANAVLHALSATRPKTRYLVGTDALKYNLLRWLLPDWLLDRVI